MATEHSSLSIEEYRALRQTIRQRGSLRHALALITFCVWAATMLFVLYVSVIPTFSLVPLFVLVAGFEVGFALHVGVERVGRYLQVRYESAAEAGPMWEGTAMSLTVPAGGLDPLFGRLYLIAAVLNLVSAFWLVAGTPETSPAVWAEFALIAVLHIGAAIRWQSAAAYAKGQRARELAVFESLLKR